MRRTLFVTLLTAACGTAPLAMAQGDGPPMAVGVAAKDGVLDLSTVRSVAEAEQLARDGKLVKILLFPAEVGGEDVRENVAYVPAEAAAAQARIIGTLVRFLEEGLIDKLNVAPEYRGDSFIPVRIRYEAYHSARPGRFEPVIEVW